MSSKLLKITTEDGSESFLDPSLGEHYHSTAGAIAEARQKHAIPAEILRRYEENQGFISILDFGFGLGYNSAAALDLLFSGNITTPRVTIVALENDRMILDNICRVNPDLQGYEIFQEFSRKAGEYSGFISPFIFVRDQMTISLYLEDALKRINYLKDNSFDVVFFDPFSSGRMPQLWTLQVIRTLFSKMRKRGCLTTYSCAKHFRKKLDQSGFTWQDVPPGFERRGPSTIAYKP
jgi:tRNA U34 5-methylaminomethyl-2-thiouridine-forming methyltransferase MnmC